MMDYYISMNTTAGIHSNLMKKVQLKDSLRSSLLNAPENKEDCWLISNGYNDNGGQYLRAEHNFEWIDTILIDCDNGKSDDPSTWNKHIIEDFERDYAKYEYFIWETASSNPDRPKFRAILLLDKRLRRYNEPEKFTKRAILQIFAKYADQNSSWFFTPNKPKLGTFRGHNGDKYPSANIESIINLNIKINEAKSEFEKTRERPHKENPDGWKNLPSVKYCLRGLTKGERDQSINKACYAMKKLGYADRIGEFIDSLVVPDEFKKKFRNQYCK